MIGNRPGWGRRTKGPWETSPALRLGQGENPESRKVIRAHRVLLIYETHAMRSRKIFVSREKLFSWPRCSFWRAQVRAVPQRIATRDLRTASDSLILTGDDGGGATFMSDSDDDFPALSDEELAAMARVATGPQRDAVEDKLGRKPLGFVVEREFICWCLVAKGQVPPEVRREDRPRLDLIRSLLKPKMLLGPSEVHEVHEWASHVHSKGPWMAPVSSYLMEQCEKRVRAGLKVAGFGPVIIHGSPGVGKTHYARTVAETMGLPYVVLDGGTMNSVFQISGMERGWNGATPSPVVRLIAEGGIANPVIIIDEIDKIAASPNGGNPHSALLGMLEGRSARAWRCPYTELEIDLSRVSWLMTANDVSRIPAPMLDRCRVIRAQEPGPEDLARFVRGLLADQDPEVVERAARAAAGMSLRRAARMADAVIAAGTRTLLN